jgi:hypothetical protein
VHLSSHEELISGSVRGPERTLATYARSPPWRPNPLSFFFAGVEKHLHRLHRLAYSVCLHASLTEVAVASFTEALLGLTGMLQLQAKAKAPDVSTILKSC